MFWFMLSFSFFFQGRCSQREVWGQQTTGLLSSQINFSFFFFLVIFSFGSWTLICLFYNAFFWIDQKTMMVKSQLIYTPNSVTGCLVLASVGSEVNYVALIKAESISLVVNEKWLYWGDRMKTWPDGFPLEYDWYCLCEWMGRQWWWKMNNLNNICWVAQEM